MENFEDDRRVVVVNGPNLNLLGTREPEIYGTQTLEDVEALCRKTAEAAGVKLEFFQSNHEGELIDVIHGARGARGLVINAGAYTHTSVALRDAVAASEARAVEVHLSNTHAREAFRAHSFLSPVVEAVIMGAGIDGYAYAINLLAR